MARTSILDGNPPKASLTQGTWRRDPQLNTYGPVLWTNLVELVCHCAAQSAGIVCRPKPFSFEGPLGFPIFQMRRAAHQVPGWPPTTVENLCDGCRLNADRKQIGLEIGSPKQELHSRPFRFRMLRAIHWSKGSGHIRLASVRLIARRSTADWSLWKIRICRHRAPSLPTRLFLEFVHCQH